MALQFEEGKFITLNETDDNSTHIVVNKNQVYKTNVYYEQYNTEDDLYSRIHELIVKYNYVLEKAYPYEYVLTNSTNMDYVHVQCENGNYVLSLVQPDKMH